MFPDSEIAKKFSCKRTKTTHILNESMAPQLEEKVTDLCRTNKFSIMMDESNDAGSEKCVAILVRVLDRTVQRVATRFLAMPNCNVGNGANLFPCLQQVFVEHGLDWKQCVGYSSDNASVMVGRHNSVLSRIREVQPKIYDLGCVCHVTNTCVQYGLKKLSPAVEGLLIDVYFYFFHSSKRKEELKEFQAFTDTEPAKLLKHCSTRWLSLERCVHRLLDQWPALQAYFNSHDDAECSGSRVQRCAENLLSPHLKLTYLFVDYIMGPLNEFNTTVQADESQIGFLHSEMARVLRKFMGKFVTTAAIKKASSVDLVDFKNPNIQFGDDLVAVGGATRRYIQENEDDLADDTLKTFFKAFYQEVTDKMLKKFSFEDEILQPLGFLNPELRQAIKPSAVVNLSERFDLVQPENLLEEVLDFQLSPDMDLPPNKDRLDAYWLQMERLKAPSGRRFPHLSKHCPDSPQSTTQ